MKSLSLKWLVLIACGMAYGFVVSAPQFIDITYPGSLNTTPMDINNRGQIVGFYDTSNGFLYERGNFTPLHYPGALSTKPFGINDHGEVVGIFADAGGNHGFVCKRDVYSPLDVPGGLNTGAYGINNRGQIVGDCTIEGQGYGWVYDGDDYLLLSCPNTSATNARGVNDRGQVVGSFFMDGQIAGGYLYDRGQYFPTNVVAGTTPRFWDINARGQIVGQIWGPPRVFLLYRGDVTTMQYAGSDSTFGRGVNDEGQVVGFYRIADEYHGFLTK